MPAFKSRLCPSAFELHATQLMLHPSPLSFRAKGLLAGCGCATGALGSALLETVLELAWHELERSHAAGTGGLSSLGLLTPVVCRSDVSMLLVSWLGVRFDAEACIVGGQDEVNRRTLSNASAWVSAVGASVLLDVHRAAACVTSSISIRSSKSSSLHSTNVQSQYAPSSISLSSHLLSSLRWSTHRNVCTERASCCGAFRSWTFPWLLPIVSDPISSIAALCAVERTHFDGVRG